MHFALPVRTSIRHVSCLPVAATAAATAALKAQPDYRTVIDTPLLAPITKDRENPIAVGTTQAVTAAHPWGTLGQTEDVARAAVFLVSEDSQVRNIVPLEHWVSFS